MPFTLRQWIWLHVSITHSRPPRTIWIPFLLAFSWYDSYTPNILASVQIYYWGAWWTVLYCFLPWFILLGEYPFTSKIKCFPDERPGQSPPGVCIYEVNRVFLWEWSNCLFSTIFKKQIACVGADARQTLGSGFIDSTPVNSPSCQEKWRECRFIQSVWPPIEVLECLEQRVLERLFWVLDCLGLYVSTV